jgi:hypothetical protein
MLKTLAVSTLLLCSTIAFAQPAAARDRDDHQNNYRDNRDRDHYARNYDRRDDRDHDRDDWRAPAPARYGDRFGNGDQRYGYYDRFGNWCWY